MDERDSIASGNNTHEPRTHEDTSTASTSSTTDDQSITRLRNPIGRINALVRYVNEHLIKCIAGCRANCVKPPEPLDKHYRITTGQWGDMIGKLGDLKTRFQTAGIITGMASTGSDNIRCLNKDELRHFTAILEYLQVLLWICEEGPLKNQQPEREQQDTLNIIDTERTVFARILVENTDAHPDERFIKPRDMFFEAPLQQIMRCLELFVWCVVWFKDMV